MIQFCEIINRGTSIRIVTRDYNTEKFNEPIEFDTEIEVNTLEELIITIKDYLDNVNLDRSS
jgi:hypothetical protein